VIPDGAFDRLPVFDAPGLDEDIERLKGAFSAFCHPDLLQPLGFRLLALLQFVQHARRSCVYPAAPATSLLPHFPRSPSGGPALLRRPQARSRPQVRAPSGGAAAPSRIAHSPERRQSGRPTLLPSVGAPMMSSRHCAPRHLAQGRIAALPAAPESQRWRTTEAAHWSKRLANLKRHLAGSG